MKRLTAAALSIGLFCAAGSLHAQGRVRQHGRAIVEYSSPQIKAVAAYEYSRRNHKGAWLLVELAVQTKERVAIHRDQISLLSADERRRIPVASQEQFLEDHEELNRLLQNALVSRRPLDSYFTTRPQPTIQFFSFPGRIVHDSAISNLDEVAAGDVLFKSPDGRWPAGTYRLVINHEEARAELPLALE